MSTMTDDVHMTIERRLSSSRIGLAVGLPVATLLLAIAFLACFIYHRRKGPVVEEEPAVSEEPEEKEPKVVELQDTDSNEESSVESEVNLMESCCDVHLCASASCEVCRQGLQPSFVVAPALSSESAAMLRTAPMRWWDQNSEKNENADEEQARMQPEGPMETEDKYCVEAEDDKENGAVLTGTYTNDSEPYTEFDVTQDYDDDDDDDDYDSDLSGENAV